MPAGYGFDYLNADGLIHAISVENGQLATHSGMRYRILVLDPYSQHMSLPVLRAIHSLVAAGAVVAGPKPTDTPSLADDQAEFNRLNDELFGDGAGVHSVGKGKVYAGQDAASALQALNVAPDFEHTKPQADTRIEFVHRKLAGADIYFLDNRNERDETFDATFRITGKAPELWHAETGKTEPASYTIANGRTTVPLHLEPWGTVFVVFRQAGNRAFAHLASRGGDKPEHARWAMERRVPARPRRAGVDHARQADLVERQRRRGREVFLRQRHLHAQPSGFGGRGSGPAPGFGSTWAM